MNPQRYNKATIGFAVTGLLGIFKAFFPEYAAMTDLAAPLLIGAAVYGVPNAQ